MKAKRQGCVGGVTGWLARVGRGREECEFTWENRVEARAPADSAKPPARHLPSESRKSYDGCYEKEDRIADLPRV